MSEFYHGIQRSARALSMLGQSGAILGFELVELVKSQDPSIFVTTADYGSPAGALRFKNLKPDNYINCGIAEQNMIGVAAGIASTGAKSIAVAQACFITMRGFEPVRQYCGYMKLPIILIGVSSGFALQFFGNSHYALEDIALMQLMPNMCIFTPSDAISAIHCFHLSLSKDRPCYIRCTGGVRSPIIYRDIGELNGSYAQHFFGKKIGVVSAGAITANVLQAVNELEIQDEVTVFDIFEHTALDDNFFSHLASFDKVYLLEEHGSDNGVGNYIRKKTGGFSLNISQPIIPVFGHRVGTREYLLQQHGLDVESIKQLFS